MRKEAFYMLSFRNTHYAMLTETQLKNAVPLSVMPTLREVTQSCGISLRIEEEHLPLLFQALQKINVPPEVYTLYHADKSGVQKISPIPLA